MPVTVPSFRHRVRSLLHDLNISDYVVSTPRMNEVIASRYRVIAERIGVGPRWMPNAVPLVAGVFDYALAAGALSGVWLASQNWPLVKRMPGMLNEMRAGNPVATGDPTDYALIEDTTLASAVTLRLYPTPHRADALSLFLSIIETLTDPPAETDTIDLSELGVVALEHDVAAHLLLGMMEEDRRRIGVNVDLAAAWGREANELVQREVVRRNRLKRVDRIERVVG